MAETHPAPAEDGLNVVARRLREARDRHLKRLDVYRCAGYDRPEAVRFVVDRAGRFAGPILDVGSGQGMLATEFARRAFDVVSIDVDPEEQLTAIVNAQMEGLSDRIRFLCGDGAHVPFSDGSFGAAAAMDALHHLREGPPVFAEMVRVVRPSGKILVAEFDGRGLEIVARVHQSEGRHHPVGPVTLGAAIDWFLAAGLKLESRGLGHFHSIVVFRKP
jgi:SAM-dependent methyltransferase